ncbi:MAG: hypothetical protein K6F15_07285 [Treponema sp.]|nr:hypothetical protein [Treponema sp.]
MKTTGFASPATEYEQERLDFNRVLRPFPAAEFEFRFKGNDMEEHHIQNGDLLIIDRSKKPKDGSIVVLIHEGSFLCRQILFSKKWKCFVFKHQNRWERVYDIFGVATYNIHTLSGNDL